MTVQEIDTKPVNERTVEMLEKALKLAKEGEIYCAGMVAVWHDGATSNCFTASYKTVSLLGELRCLEHEVMQMQIDTRLHKAGELM